MRLNSQILEGQQAIFPKGKGFYTVSDKAVLAIKIATKKGP